MAAYRRRKATDTWHFCWNCSKYPRIDFDEQQEEPTTGELCKECEAKRKDNNCE